METPKRGRGRPKTLPEARKRAIFARATVGEVEAAKVAWRAAQAQEPGLPWGEWVRRKSAEMPANENKA